MAYLGSFWRTSKTKQRYCFCEALFCEGRITAHERTVSVKPPSSGHPSDRVKWHEENRSRSRVGNPSQHHRRHESMVLQHRTLPSGGPGGNGLVMVTCITKQSQVPRVCQNIQAQ